MEYIYYYDITIGKTHVEKHSISEKEIDEFFNEIKYYTCKRADYSLSSVGKLKSGRFLNIIYRKKGKDKLFIITAYDIEDKEIINMILDNEAQ